MGIFICIFFIYIFVSLHKLSAILLIISMQFSQSARAATIAENSQSLIGTWDIYDSSNNKIDSIEITIAVSKQETARFSFTQGSQSGTSSYQGLLMNENTIIFNLISLGMLKTYIATLDFTTGSGPGLEMSNTVADCSETVGIDKDLVAKKNRSRMASSTAICDGSSLSNASRTEIKIVKSGSDINQVPAAAEISTDDSERALKLDDRLSGSWQINAKNRKNRRLVIKDFEASPYGFLFSYRAINSKKRLTKLTESDFLSGTRTGFFIDNRMLISTTEFNDDDKWLSLKISGTSGSGQEFITPNGDCFPLKDGDASKRVCTPNDDASRINNKTKKFKNRKIRKIRSSVTISF